jgi:hypothetical protein
MTLYAVSVTDLVNLKLRNNIDDMMALVMLEPVIDPHNTLKVRDDIIDGTAIVLSCDDTRSKAIIEILQEKNLGLRFYETKHEAKGSKWVEIPN